MSEELFKARSIRILYDSERITAVSPEWLQPEFWRMRNDILAELGGRGQALLVSTPVGPAVLRRYLRGGLVARVSHDRFLFTGYDNSRALVEWRALAELNRRQLPVPRPLMAICERKGPIYRAGILTALIPDTRSLADVAHELGEDDWRRLGRTLQAFFSSGVVHADLNAHNILLDKSGQWYLIDFDRARIRDRPVLPDRMLNRLFRSFDKLGIDARRDLLGPVAGPR
jgi:3-deoxy-D-manno-octulosonic acid kinase